MLVCCLLGAAGVHHQCWYEPVFRRICCNSRILRLTQCSDLGPYLSRVFVWWCKLARVVSGLFFSFQPVFAPVVVDWTWSFFPRVDTRVSTGGCCVQVLWAGRLIRFTGAVIVCWKGNGLDISFLCISLFLFVATVWSVSDIAVCILYLNLMSSDLLFIILFVEYKKIFEFVTTNWTSRFFLFVGMSFPVWILGPLSFSSTLPDGRLFLPRNFGWCRLKGPLSLLKRHFWG